MTTHSRIVLAARPSASVPVTACFELLEGPLREELADDEVLVEHAFLSLDPYMRGRMNDTKSYAPPQPLGEVMIGGTVGRVVASKSARFAVGDAVLGMGGWQSHAHVVVPKEGRSGLQKIDTRSIPISAYLGPVGMPGVTAWYGLTQLLEAREGQTVLVSAASGAVGSVVGQLAKARGCRAVGIAGGPEKCAYVVDELGFDACVDHRAHDGIASLARAIGEACPSGVDRVFENVGGACLDAALLQMNAFGRVALCGMIAGYDGAPIPLQYPQLLLTQRVRVEGFIVSEHLEHWPAALAELGAAVAKGTLRYRETVSEGLASAPEAFAGLLRGANFGKQLVKL